MSHRTPWSDDLASAVRDPAVLLERLGLPTDLASTSAAADFPLLVPESFLNRMRFGDRSDPLLRQVLPVVDETYAVEGFTVDAVNDLSNRSEAGVISKYPGRVLLIAAGSCAVHCRYCFRRHYPYSEEPRTLDDWEPSLNSIAADPSIREVILSGGDPLMLRDARLRDLLLLIDAIPHVRRVRLHSRLPIVLPSRVCDPLIQTLRDLRSQPWVVVHANHAAELVDDCADALRTLVRSGLPVLNQAVLLRGVNDTTEAQVLLCERLIDLGVRPYYLNVLDRVTGAAHFEVSEKYAAKIIRGVRDSLPGYAVPQVVRDHGTGPSKRPIEA